ncbi:MAG: HAD family phosphatase [Verrucomicrobiae bacterium]|nr:HAD family phosphatase [Verrucomicrobiae bacterium]
MSQKAVIFDMDGVLVDTEPFYMDIDLALFERFGVKAQHERLFSYIGIPAERMWSELKRDFGLQLTVTELVELERAEMRRKFEEMKRIPKMKGVSGLIRALERKGVVLGVASSSSRIIIDLLLAKTGLAEHFAVTVSGQEVARGKPSPDIFLAAAAGLKRKPDDCVVIEDSPHGIQGAAESGMKTIGVVSPNSGNQDLSKADLIVGDFSPSNIRKILALF